jgi:hypothetical protein
MDTRFNRVLMTLLVGACFGGAADVRAAGPPHSIVLPPILVAEAPATIAVLDASGRLVPGVDVTLSNGKAIKTDATGRARLVVPAGAGEFEARIPAGSIVATAPIEVATTAAAIRVTDFPPVIDARDQFAIFGERFQGDADENHVWLGTNATLVLAASPAALVLLPAPETPLGPTQLRVEGNGTPPAPAAVTIVEVDAINPAGPLRIGQPATLTVRVRGTTEPLEVELGNWSPTVIKMLPPTGAAAAGNSQSADPNVRRLKTSGGANNEAQIEIVPLGSGKFYVRARLARSRS